MKEEAGGDLQRERKRLNWEGEKRELPACFVCSGWKQSTRMLFTWL